MNLTKLTFPGLDVWIDLNDVVYMEREKRPETLLVLPNEKDFYTKLALKSGKVIAVVETPDYILGLMKGVDPEKASYPTKSIYPTIYKDAGETE